MISILILLLFIGFLAKFNRFINQLEQENIDNMFFVGRKRYFRGVRE